MTADWKQKQKENPAIFYEARYDIKETHKTAKHATLITNFFLILENISIAHKNVIFIWTCNVLLLLFK